MSVGTMFEHFSAQVADYKPLIALIAICNILGIGYGVYKGIVSFWRNYATVPIAQWKSRRAELAAFAASDVRLLVTLVTLRIMGIAALSPFLLFGLFLLLTDKSDFIRGFAYSTFVLNGIFIVAQAFNLIFIMMGVTRVIVRERSTCQHRKSQS